MKHNRGGGGEMASKKSSADPRGIAKSRRPSAFISASYSIDTNVLLRAIQERGLETIRLDETMRGLSISESIRKSMEGADYVIAVMGENPPNANVLFELGIATGMGKQVLVLAPQDAKIPASLAGLTYLRTDPHNRVAIEFALDLLLSAPNKARAIPQAPGDRETHPIGNSADRLLETLRLSRLAGDLKETQLIDIISEAIKESGVSTLSKESRLVGKRVADLAVWSEDLEPWVGNPLIIEVKKTLTEKKHLESTIQHISTLLDETRSPRGLVIYLDANPSVLYGGAYDPRILVMSVEEFIGGLRNLGLGDLLREARNESAHVGG
jgi:hypothetical protein